MSSAAKQVSLKPVAGFCVKSNILQDGVLGRKGAKVFVNIAYDELVPAPPPATEEAIQRAMKGQDDEHLSDDGWYVPVVVSEPRPDVDKGTLGFSMPNSQLD